MAKNYVKSIPDQPQMRLSQQPASNPSQARTRRLNRLNAAAFLGVSISWLDKARMTGRGPPYITIGSRVVYDEAALATFLERNTRTSTSS